MRKIALFLLIAPALLGVTSTYTKRLGQSTSVLRDMSRANDQGVPQDLLSKAQCVVVIPSLKKVAFIGGAKYGRGFATCLHNGVWTAPAAMRIEGGSFGIQLGVSSTDVILLVMNEGGMRKILADKVTIGGEAAAAAGPVGRNLSAKTDVLLKAEILTYSRSRGVFAGLSLEGATLRQDTEENQNVYGKPYTSQEILSGGVPRTAAEGPFLREVERFSGKGSPKPSRRKRRAAASTNTSAMTSSATGTAATAAGSSASTATGTDNTRVNKRDRPTGSVTADQQKNNTSDLDLTKQIRRSVIADKSLSTYAHNVKIVATGGTVTLRGPVRSEDEKNAVAAKAAAVVGADHVVNQIEIAPPK